VREKLRHIPAKKVMTDHSRQLTKKVYICVCKGTDEIRRSINIVVDFLVFFFMNGIYRSPEAVGVLGEWITRHRRQGANRQRGLGT